ncbi:cupin domain-containing protein [Aspergillus homomorphus CBS 101889]|uniref:Cupin domain protein n=1 Tax=Aspergillus homomorphus (strain CBS 101889) TaxID=1450537 RepID=A0A395I2J8_ASPHC|nr:cupin domain protein [Aspergillus homomorphus CBS 101889]RAL13955.1 cupin domain protein [Aspergillus homomorphus CBS 101889]
MEEPTYDPSRPLATTTIAYQYKLVNCPGKTIVGLLVEYPPAGATPPHRHGGASVSAYVIKGSVLNKMNDDPMRVIEQGGSWYEAPGCHHRISANASQTEPAAFFVNFVLDTETLEREGPGVLVQIDEEYREIVAQKMKTEAA